MGRTIIDSLVVTLGLDATDFAKGAATATASLNQTNAVAGRTAGDLQIKGRQAAQFFSRIRSGSVELAQRQTASGAAIRNTAQIAGRAALDMQSKGNVAGEFFSKIKNQALSLMTVLIGGKSVFGTIAQTTTTLAAIGKQAGIAGMPVGDLAAFRNVVEANGDSADAAGSSFEQLRRNQQAYQETGTAPNLLGLNRIGATAHDSATQVMQKFAAYADAHKDNNAQVRRVGEQLGLDQGLINVGAKGSASLNRELAGARERGLPNAGMTERALALQSAYHKVMQSAGHLTDVLVDRFAPALTRILDTITAFIIAAPNAATAIGIATSVLAGLSLPAVLRGLARGVLGTGAAAIPAIEGAEAGGGVLAAAMLFGRTLISLFTRWFPWLGIAAIALDPTPTGGADEDKRVSQEGPGAATRRAEANNPAGVRDQAHDFFMQKGLTEEQTAGILANIKAESAFNPQAADGTGAHGLFQHQGPRWEALQASANSAMPSTQQQLEFAWGEMSGPGPNGILAELRATRTAEDAARVVTRRYERPANPDKRSEQRAVMARDQLSQNMRGVRQDNAAPPVAANTNTTNSSHSTVAINGPITIHTQATDARGIAGSLHAELRSRGLVAQANRGLS